MNKSNLFYSRDYDIVIELKIDILKQIHQKCIESYPKETGGVLFGYYKEKNLAFITDIWEEKSIVNKNKTRFIRGTNGLKNISDKLWKQNIYYLGEWHYHPNGTCDASNTDIQTIIGISENNMYKCPEPIMLIVSSINTKSFSEVAYLVNKKSLIVLKRQ